MKMSSSGRMDSKRIDAYRKLREAAELFARAAEKHLEAVEALGLLEQGRKRITQASRSAQPTVLDGKKKRDGLPSGIRGMISRLAEKADQVAQRVKDVPVTKDQRLVARTERHRRTAG